MKKLMLCLLFFPAFMSSAQEYGHGLGAQTNIAFVKDTIGSLVTFTSQPVAGFTYNARLDWEVGRDAVFSASAYPFIGGFINASSNTSTGGSGSAAFGVELPIVAQIFVGDDWGFFAGAGWDFAFMAGTNFGAIGQLGPTGTIGMQTPFFGGRHLRIRGGYTNDVLHKGSHLISIGVMFMFDG